MCQFTCSDLDIYICGLPMSYIDEEYRKQIVKLSITNDLIIRDSFLIPVCKFGRTLFTKSFKEIVTYG